VYGRAHVLSRSLLVVALAAMLASCVRVRSHEREYLSKRAMTQDRAAGERRFNQHQTGSREGADGGTGEPGGGCGCN
jgi:hypothetical protein